MKVVYLRLMSSKMILIAVGDSITIIMTGSEQITIFHVFIFKALQLTVCINAFPLS